MVSSADGVSQLCCPHLTYNKYDTLTTSWFMLVLIHWQLSYVHLLKRAVRWDWKLCNNLTKPVMNNKMRNYTVCFCAFSTFTVINTESQQLRKRRAKKGKEKVWESDVITAKRHKYEVINTLWWWIWNIKSLIMWHVM